jgi:hypothetical protein
MAFLGRTPSNAPLTSADIPAGIIEGSDIGFLSATATENISGTLEANSCNLSQAFVMTGDITVSGNSALAKIGNDGTTTPLLTNDGSTRTISGTGTLTLGVLV